MPKNNSDSAVKKLQEMSDENLLKIWKNLKGYDSEEQYAPGISMDDWASLVHTEISKRNLYSERDWDFDCKLAWQAV